MRDISSNAQSSATENDMEKIASFKIDHEKLLRGIYVSRQDKAGAETLTTFDIRMTEPNREPVMNTAEIHAIEHLGATYLRNRDDIKDKVIYFGPMGCRTGFYLIIAGDITSREVLPTVEEMFAFIENFEGNVPGSDPVSCGNCLDINLPMAKYLAKKFRSEVIDCITDANLIYPE